MDDFRSRTLLQNLFRLTCDSALLNELKYSQKHKFTAKIRNQNCEFEIIPKPFLIKNVFFIKSVFFTLCLTVVRQNWNILCSKNLFCVFHILHILRILHQKNQIVNQNSIETRVICRKKSFSQQKI